jgi:heptosyltransferase II
MGLKILIRTPNHLGDCIMSLPMINETREAYPGSHVTLLTPEYLAELYENNTGIDAVLRIPAKYIHGMMAVMKIKELIAPHKFELGFILPPSFGAAAGFKLAGIPERIGYVADGRRLLLSRPLPLPAPLNSQHRAVTYFELLKRAAGADIEFVRPKLFLAENDIKKGVSLLEGLGIAETDQYAVIAFQAVAESRRWGLDNYRALIEKLISDYGLKIILMGGVSDQKVGEELAVSMGNKSVVNLAGKTNLRESAAVISRSIVFVGNDSGPAHLAAAVDAPTVVLSGADDPNETSPLARNKRLIYLSNLECISCVKNKCQIKGIGFMKCMKDISVNTVLEQIEDIRREAGR